jgi:hypothetical protein
MGSIELDGMRARDLDAVDMDARQGSFFPRLSELSADGNSPKLVGLIYERASYEIGLGPLSPRTKPPSRSNKHERHERTGPSTALNHQ